MNQTHLIEVLEKDLLLHKIKLRVYLLNYEAQYLSLDLYNATFLSLLFKNISYVDPLRIKITDELLLKKKSNYVINKMVQCIDIIEKIERSPIHNNVDNISIDYFKDIIENQNYIEQRMSLLYADFDIFFSDDIYFSHLEVGDLWSDFLLNIQSAFIDKQYEEFLPQIKFSHRELELSKHITHIKFSSDSKQLFLISNKNVLSAYVVGRWNQIWGIFIDSNLSFDKIYEDSKRDLVWLQNKNNVVAIYNRKTGEKLQNINLVTGDIISDKGNYMAYFNNNNTIDIKNQKGDILLNIHCKEIPIFAIFNSEENLFAFHSKESIYIWDIKNKQEINSLYFSKKSIKQFAFAPKNDFISICFEEENLQIFNWKTKELILEFPREIYRYDATFDAAYWTNNNKYFCVIRRFNYGNDMIIFPMQNSKNNIPLHEEIIPLKNEIIQFRESIKEELKLLRSLPKNNASILYYTQETFANMTKNNAFFWKKLAKELANAGFKKEADICLDPSLQ